MFGLKVWLVFLKGIILIKHKSYLIKLKNIYFLYEFLKKKKKNQLQLYSIHPSNLLSKTRLCTFMFGRWGGGGGGRYMHDVVPLADTSLFFLRLTKNTFFPCSFMKMVKPQYINWHQKHVGFYHGVLSNSSVSCIVNSSRIWT